MSRSRRAVVGAIKRKHKVLGGGSDTTVSATASSFTSDDYDILANGTDDAAFTITARNASGVALADKAATISRESISVSAANSTIAVALDSIATGEETTVTITLRDGSNRPVPWILGSDIVVSSTGTGNTIGTLAGSTNQSGIIACTFESSVAQAKTLSFTVFGVSMTDTAAVTVTATGEDYSIRAPEVTDLYLDPNAGTDGTGTEASPWNVFTNAKVSTLTAGQILWIKDGTFNWASLTTLPSGTSGNRIKIAAYPGDSPTAVLSSSTTGFDSSYGFGATSGSADYWDIYGINFTLAGRAGIIFGANQWSNPSLTCSNVRVINCTGNTSLAASDNGGILFFDGNSDYVEVVGGSYDAAGASGGSGTNRALIWADYQTHIKIIGVLLNAAGTSLPFYYKHTNLQTPAECERVFANNICLAGSRGTLFCGKYFQTTNNVFSGALVDFGDQGGGDVGRGENTLRHNTFYNSTVGFTTNGTGGENYDNILQDNVIAGTTELWDNPYAATDINTVSSYNAYRSGSAIRRNSSTYTVAGYQTAFTDREISSVQGTISFVGTVPSSTPADWALAGGSTGENAASDGSDCGVVVANLLTTTL